MTGDLIINGKDAYNTFGVNMGDGFLNSIMSFTPIKSFIENKSRLEDGKQVLYNTPKYDERDVTLTFYIEGNTQDEYLQNYNAFQAELKKGLIELKIPALNSEIYRLTYLNSQNYSMNRSRTFSKFSVKFNEPNPANRK